MKNRLVYYGLVGATILLVACGGTLTPVYSTVYNELPASVLMLEKDTLAFWVADYFPTMERWDSVTSSTLDILPADSFSGDMQIVSNGACPALNTLDFWNQGSKVSVVARKQNEETDWNKGLYAFTIGQSGTTFRVVFSEHPDELLVCWQNSVLAKNAFRWDKDTLVVTVPEVAALMDRSFIRVWAAAQGCIANDLLVPLEGGRVLSDISEVRRTDKHAQVLYSLMIDRFCNGDTLNDCPLNRPDVLPSVDFQGGDFQGITNKIRSGFFSELGVNTIWITPIVQNPEEPWGVDKDPYTRFSAYHGYWPLHPTVLNPHFGTEAQLKDLLHEAHQHDMNVIVDYVANHLHQNSPILKEHPDWATPMYTADGRLNVRLFDEQRLTTWFDTFLPTLDLEKEEVREAMTDSALYWLQHYDFDGFRHDAAKHIHESYWRLLTRKIRKNPRWNHLYQIGETYGSISLVRSYVKSGMLDGQFDFNIYHKAVNTFGFPEGDMRLLSDELHKSLDNYGYHNLMGYISGNHDKPRFISVAGGTVSLSEDTKAAGRKRKITVGDTVAYDKLALLEAFMLTIPGVPCIYQGDEYGVPGANDPDNRRMMQFGG